MDIRNYPDVIEALNAILSNRGTAEIKLENKGRDLVVVESLRQLKNKTSVKE